MWFCFWVIHSGCEYADRFSRYVLVAVCLFKPYTLAWNRRLMNFIEFPVTWAVITPQYLLSEFDKAICQYVLAGLANFTLPMSRSATESNSRFPPVSHPCRSPRRYLLAGQIREWRLKGCIGRRNLFPMRDDSLLLQSRRGQLRCVGLPIRFGVVPPRRALHPRP